MKVTRLSVIVPTLDTKDLTVACVESVVASRLPDGVGLEVVVVDDGSRDGTAEALGGRERVRVVRNQEPTGFARAANRGASEAGGDLLVFLNSDTVVEGASLARVVEAFEVEASLGVAGAALHDPDGSPQWSAGPTPGLAWLFGQATGIPALLGRLPGWRSVRPLHGAEPREVSWVSGAAMAVRKSLWTEAGPFDETYGFYVQDLAFCLRVREGGWRIRLLPGFRVLHYRGATIASSGDAVAHGADLGLLWSDLVLWAERRGGAVFARRARAALRIGSGLRLFARRLASPLVGPVRRDVWRRDTQALARARAVIAPSRG